jgi:hypothetical protein
MLKDSQFGKFMLRLWGAAPSVRLCLGTLLVAGFAAGIVFWGGSTPPWKLPTARRSVFPAMNGGKRL